MKGTIFIVSHPPTYRPPSTDQIRKKIKMEQFDVTILDELVDEFIAILNEYLPLFISILDKLFRDKNDSMVAFATHGFK